MSDSVPRHDAFAALRFGNFRNLLGGTFLITCALQMQRVALGYTLYLLTRDPLSLGLLGLAEAIPFMGLALFGGHMADRRDKRRMMQFAGAVFMSGTLLLFSASLPGVRAAVPQPTLVGLIYGVVFIEGLARGLYSPASSSLKPFLVPREHYGNSATWSSMSWQAGAILGPALGGFVFAAVGLPGTLAVVAVLIATERLLRQRSRRWNLDGSRGGGHVWPLTGWRATLAQLLCALPPLGAVAIPLLWIQQGWQGLEAESMAELGQLASRSLGLALLATAVTGLGALLLAISRRWSPQPLVRQLSFLAGLGYAIPGSVLALGLILLGAPLGFSPVVLLLWGYGDRFIAVSKQGLDAALERIPPSIDESATSLGCDWLGVLRRIHLPLLRGPLMVGSLLVFVDVVKELPITLALRPFDFDTLAVRVFQYASDERVGAAMAPALLIMLFGLIAAFALVPSLEQGD